MMKIKKDEDKSRITYKGKKQEYEPRVVKTVEREDKRFCKSFSKGEDNFCVNYTGSKRDICSCCYNCKIYKPKKKK